MKEKIIILIITFCILLLGMIFCTSVKQKKSSKIETYYQEMIMVEAVRTKTMRRIINSQPLEVKYKKKILTTIECFEIILLECRLGYILNFEYYIKSHDNWIPENNYFDFNIYLYDNQDRLSYVYKIIIEINPKNDGLYFGKKDFILSKPEFLYLSGVEKIKVELRPSKWKKNIIGNI